MVSHILFVIALCIMLGIHSVGYGAHEDWYLVHFASLAHLRFLTHTRVSNIVLGDGIEHFFFLGLCKKVFALQMIMLALVLIRHWFLTCQCKHLLHLVPIQTKVAQVEKANILCCIKYLLSTCVNISVKKRKVNDRDMRNIRGDGHAADECRKRANW